MKEGDFVFHMESHLKSPFHKTSFNSLCQRSSLILKEGGYSLLLLKKWVKTINFSCIMSHKNKNRLSEYSNHIYIYCATSKLKINKDKTL